MAALEMSETVRELLTKINKLSLGYYYIDVFYKDASFKGKYGTLCWFTFLHNMQHSSLNKEQNGAFLGDKAQRRTIKV